MRWEQLLSPERPVSDSLRNSNRDLRSEFEKDHHHIIVSSSFRRLQDKTQVFPLDKSDFIRTRLTHSLEVSSIAKSLGQNVSSAILKERPEEGFDRTKAAHMCEILECAGLIHDIGNPPFGHFGEETIRAWFKTHLHELKCGGQYVSLILTEQQLSDLMGFEGNAQGLRMVTKLDSPVPDAGMNLTYGLLSAMIKYPSSSLVSDSTAEDIRLKKNGYFSSEQAIFEEIAAKTGTGNARNPLSFILEAADDIAYAAADIEDAFKKGFFDYQTLSRELYERGTAKEYMKRLSDRYDIERLAGNKDAEESAVRGWLREMQDELIIAAAEGFMTHYRQIMDGHYMKELISGKRASVLLSALKSIAYDYAFTSMSIFKTEIAANRILTFLLDMLVPAVCEMDEEHPDHMNEKYLSLIPDQYLRMCRIGMKDSDPSERLFAKILAATDTVSGMTDSYAKDLYSELTGLL